LQCFNIDAGKARGKALLHVTGMKKPGNAGL
jgi:hypothetical protein